MKLGALAHSRAGDKGNLVNLSVIAFDERDYPRLARTVTVQRVRTLFEAIGIGEVVRYELPQLGALNFVLARAPGETVTRTLGLDPHGKTLSSALLDLDIEE